MNIRDFFLKFSITINDLSYFNEAFTHNSYSNENRLSKNYQRLEFLGDAILQMKVSEFLYRKYPQSNEGVLTKYRSSIVRKETLASLSRKFGLTNFIRLGVGERESKGYEKDSILSDIFESITAAIYLDQGDEILKIWLEKTIFSCDIMNFYLDDSHDYKSELQELIQIEMRTELSYKTISQEKEENNQNLFTVNVILDEMVFGTGQGTNKKQAEQAAAKSALSKIKKTFKN
ncbi:ribonuclease III [Spiroplasma taiwanense]|uniref:Ribonuclease 3 n=1 Tax=Spiroplasma taiwanense CT-1 TaxID=1276220 RepID=S5MHZ8_9MOLU|nr:ribonuclease III [Spiroplasma taiwanense]AGR41515.1 ribonuclease III [Spiroplasma taiwanense CT-1]